MHCGQGAALQLVADARHSRHPAAPLQPVQHLHSPGGRRRLGGTVWTAIGATECSESAPQDSVQHTAFLGMGPGPPIPSAAPACCTALVPGREPYVNLPRWMFLTHGMYVAA